MKTLENFVANSAITRQKESVIRYLVRTADSHGFTPKCVDDGGAVLYTLDEESVLDVVFSVNCSEVFFSGYGTHHSVEIDLSSCPSEIIADTSNHPKWEKCLKTVEKFCVALQEPRPTLTHREAELLKALQYLYGWCIQKLEPSISGLAYYPALQRDMSLARKAISEATGNND